MSRSQSRATTSVSLFPFLAVLICAMGALIFLLLITTQRIRQDAVARHQQSIAETTPVEPSTPEFIEPPEPEPPEPEPEAIVEWSPPEPEPEQVDPNIEWRQAVKRISRERDYRLVRFKQQQSDSKNARTQLADFQHRLDETKKQIKQNQQQRQSDDRINREEQTAQAELSETISLGKHRLEETRRRQTDAATKYAFVPFDGKTGTIRRPILIECTEDGIRFLPENISLTSDDLEGFTPGFNPILAGAQSLVDYWTDRNLAANALQPEPEPYVLMVVRPGGSMAYYAARSFLAKLDRPFGYELLEEDWQLDLPESDPLATAVCRRAVDRHLRERSKLKKTLAVQRDINNRGIRYRAGSGGIQNEDPDSSSFGEPGGRTHNFGKRRPAGTGADDGFDGATDPNQTTFGQTDRFGNRELDGRSNGSHPGSRRSPSRLPTASGRANAGNNQASENNEALRSEAASGGVRKVPDPTVGNASNPESLFGNSELRPLDGGGRQPKTVRRGFREGEAPAERLFSGVSAPREPRIPSSETTSTENEHSSRIGETAEMRTDLLQEPGKTIRHGDSSDFTSTSTTGRISSDRRVSRSSATPGNGSPSRARSSLTGEYQNSFPNFSQPRKRRSRSNTNRQRSFIRKWGLSDPRASIGLERPLLIKIQENDVLVGRDSSMLMDQGQTRDQFYEQVLLAIDREARNWGKPPEDFYWVPTIRFEIRSHNKRHYRRLRAAVKRCGLSSTVTYRPKTEPNYESSRGQE